MTSFRDLISSGNQLLVFEAAARHKSFTKAADELNVSQPSVSRMIGRFEAHIGLALFARKPTGLELTADGLALFDATTRGFEGVVAVLTRLQNQRSARKIVTLSGSSAFVSHWLFPRFSAFRSENPGIELRFQLTAGEATGPLHGADLGFRFFQPSGSVTVDSHIMPEVIFAVCSPAYLETVGSLAQPQRGKKHTLIRFANPRISWETFCDNLRIELPKNFLELEFQDYAVIIQVAMAGQGIALGWNQVVFHPLKMGLLQLAHREPMTTGDHYKLFAQPEALYRAETLVVAEWIKKEMSQDRTGGGGPYCTQ